MFKIKAIIFVLFLCSLNVNAQNNLPYPIIFVHGLAGSDVTFGTTMEYLSLHDSLGDINVYDVILNADHDNTSSLFLDDVKSNDFIFNGTFINVGRRNFSPSVSTFVDGWTGSNIFAINFQEERIRGASGSVNDYFDQSNESGIFKQGYALELMIQEVLTYTNAEKVILVGHSMGGLAIREYLQRYDFVTSIHTNWVDPFSAEGHKVARVATYGTPHLGSNASPDPTKASVIPNALGDTEANRDLLWEYNSYTNCTGLAKGIYMFGGNELCIQSITGNATFPNVDINCNGVEGDDIVGINENYYSYDYNPIMPLPLNIDYTYMCSIWSSWGSSLTGDGAVSIHRQWLHQLDIPSPIGLADTTMNTIDHLSEGSDFKTIIRGIDEPEVNERAFGVALNHKVIAYVTFQSNMLPEDRDVFVVNCAGIDSLDISLTSFSSGVNMIEVYDATNTLISFFNVTSPSQLYSTVCPTDSMYFHFIGTATNTTWENPYKIEFMPKTFVGVEDIVIDYSVLLFPNPASNVLNIQNDAVKFEVIIYSLEGRFIERNVNQNKIDISDYSKGVYLLQIKTGKETITKRFIKND
ncbi:MAG TPA: T9SS type A sorting domain-containing protein [Crocinitomicaceae bacterium]|nr:T9SS type A sorting domain-containing protein [Crocinitomicaceae bacterium]